MFGSLYFFKKKKPQYIHLWIYSFAYLMCTPAPVWRSKDNSTESVLLFHLDMHPRDGTQVVQVGGRYLPQQGHFTGFWGWNSAASKSTGCQLVAILYSFMILVWIGSFDLWKLELSTRQCLYFSKRWNEAQELQMFSCGCWLEPDTLVRFPSPPLCE